MTDDEIVKNALIELYLIRMSSFFGLDLLQQTFFREIAIKNSKEWLIRNIREISALEKRIALLSIQS